MHTCAAVSSPSNPWRVEKLGLFMGTRRSWGTSLVVGVSIFIRFISIAQEKCTVDDSSALQYSSNVLIERVALGCPRSSRRSRQWLQPSPPQQSQVGMGHLALATWKAKTKRLSDAATSLTWSHWCYKVAQFTTSSAVKANPRSLATSGTQRNIMGQVASTNVTNQTLLRQATCKARQNSIGSNSPELSTSYFWKAACRDTGKTLKRCTTPSYLKMWLNSGTS